MKFPALCVLLILAAVSVQNAESCSCLRMHRQTAFKLAKFVIVAKVTKNLPPTSTHVDVTVTITHIYKGRNPARGIELNKSVVLRSFINCDVRLTVGKSYVISGDINNGILTHSICGLNIPVSTLTPEDRKLLEIYADPKNECEVPINPPSSGPTKKQCVVDSKPKVAECQYRHGACVKKGDKCHWDPTKEYKECLSK